MLGTTWRSNTCFDISTCGVGFTDVDELGRSGSETKSDLILAARVVLIAPIGLTRSINCGLSGHLF